MPKLADRIDDKNVNTKRLSEVSIIPAFTLAGSEYSDEK
jgi:hypothetical protein